MKLEGSEGKLLAAVRSLENDRDRLTRDLEKASDLYG